MVQVFEGRRMAMFASAVLFAVVGRHADARSFCRSVTFPDGQAYSRSLTRY